MVCDLKPSRLDLYGREFIKLFKRLLRPNEVAVTPRTSACETRTVNMRNLISRAAWLAKDHRASTLLVNSDTSQAIDRTFHEAKDQAREFSCLSQTAAMNPRVIGGTTAFLIRSRNARRHRVLARPVAT